jgi:hypothetical protein
MSANGRWRHVEKICRRSDTPTFDCLIEIPYAMILNNAHSSPLMTVAITATKFELVIIDWVLHQCLYSFNIKMLIQIIVMFSSNPIGYVEACSRKGATKIHNVGNSYVLYKDYRTGIRLLIGRALGLFTGASDSLRLFEKRTDTKLFRFNGGFGQSLCCQSGRYNH